MYPPADISGIALKKVLWWNVEVLDACPFPSDKQVWQGLHGVSLMALEGQLSMNVTFMFGIDHNNIHWQIHFYNFSGFLSVWYLQGINMDFDFCL